MTPEQTVTLEKIYPNLANKRLLIVEQGILADAIADYAKSMQKMDAFYRYTLPVKNGVPIPLDTYVEQQSFDFLIVHPFGTIFDDIQRLIDKGYPVIILSSGASVNRHTIDQIKKWEHADIPTVDKTKGNVSSRLMETLNTMVKQQTEETEGPRY